MSSLYAKNNNAQSLSIGCTVVSFVFITQLQVFVVVAAVVLAVLTFRAARKALNVQQA
jgi:hypothetical protein